MHLLLDHPVRPERRSGSLYADANRRGNERPGTLVVVCEPLVVGSEHVVEAHLREVHDGGARLNEARHDELSWDYDRGAVPGHKGVNARIGSRDRVEAEVIAASDLDEGFVGADLIELDGADHLVAARIRASERSRRDEPS